MTICTQCNDTGQRHAWATSGEWETEPCSCSQPVAYRVYECTLANGTPYFEVRHVETGRIAAALPSRERADETAAYRNLYHGYREADPDWTPGSNRNWWARNAGEAF